MAEDEITIRTLTTFDTVFPADTVEWCSVDPYRHILACGTYELIENESDTESASKQGEILLFRMASDEEFRLELLQKICTSAVLDMKWLHVADVETRVLLAVADSAGYLQIHQLKDDGKKIELELVTKLKVSDDKNVMALSLDWSQEKYVTSDPIVNTNILVSNSVGQVSQFTWSEKGELTKNFTWPAHKFQAWVVASDFDSQDVFYSGTAM